MLSHLKINGLAIIDSLEIDFHPGFNVITGETGAGKSILIRALGLLSGMKASSDTVRHGFESATVVGEFSLPLSHPVRLLLENLNIEVEETSTEFHLLLRRTIQSKGKSSAWINDIPVTSQTLKELGVQLFDIFAQHENQKLLDPARHVAYLDTFVSDGSLKKQVSICYKKIESSLEDLKDICRLFSEKGKNTDYLSFRLEELEKFDPSEEDYEKVKALCETSEQSVDIKEQASTGVQILEGGEDGKSLSSLAKEVARNISKVSPLVSFSERLNQVSSELDDISFELRRFLDSFEIDEEALQSAQSRLFTYQDLMRKLSAVDISALLKEKDKIAEEISLSENASAKVTEILSALAKYVTEAEKACALLSEARQKAASRFRSSVEAELSELAMPGCRLGIETSPLEKPEINLPLEAFGEAISQNWQGLKKRMSHLSEKGSEKVQFLLSSNPGEPLLPLSKVASGGELSRMMLAFKKSLAADAETCVLVFDEIDTGISGRVADVVGKKMRELSDSFQVICISHLPQVAVYADQHFLVRKSGKKNRTETELVLLSEEQSAEEIARLLSGAKVSRSSLDNARNLMKVAKTPLKKKKAKSLTDKSL
jgi:DNA repair protein RecN (Recombination protein N)